MVGHHDILIGHKHMYVYIYIYTHARAYVSIIYNIIWENVCGVIYGRNKKIGVNVARCIVDMSSLSPVLKFCVPASILDTRSCRKTVQFPDLSQFSLWFSGPFEVWMDVSLKRGWDWMGYRRTWLRRTNQGPIGFYVNSTNHVFVRFFSRAVRASQVINPNKNTPWSTENSEMVDTYGSTMVDTCYTPHPPTSAHVLGLRM